MPKLKTNAHWGHSGVCMKYHPHVVFSARCNIYISCLCYDVSVHLSVCLSVTEVHWCIIVNLGFKFRSKFTACASTCSACGHALRLAMHAGALWSRCMPGRGEGSSLAMLATAGPLVSFPILFCDPKFCSRPNTKP